MPTSQIFSLRKSRSIARPEIAAAVTSRDFVLLYMYACVEAVNCARQNKRAGRWFPISAAADVKSTSVPVPVRVTMHLCTLYRRLRFLYGHPRSCHYESTCSRTDPKPLIRRVFPSGFTVAISSRLPQSLDLPAFWCTWLGTSLIIGRTTDFHPWDPAISSRLFIRLYVTL